MKRYRVAIKNAKECRIELTFSDLCVKYSNGFSPVLKIKEGEEIANMKESHSETKYLNNHTRFFSIFSPFWIKKLEKIIKTYVNFYFYY